MWNTGKHEEPEFYKFDEHMRVLEEAVGRAAEGLPVFNKDVEKALNYFTARADRKGGLNLFLYGMREKRLDRMAEGLALLKKHLGVKR